MENNENNVQNQEKKIRKGVSLPLVIILLILVLALGIGGGFLLSKGIGFNKDENNSANNVATDNAFIQSYIGKIYTDEVGWKLKINNIDDDKINFTVTINKIYGSFDAKGKLLDKKVEFEFDPQYKLETKGYLTFDNGKILMNITEGSNQFFYKTQKLEFVEEKDGSRENGNEDINKLFNQINKDNFKKIEIGLITDTFDYTKKESTDYQLAQKIINNASNIKEVKELDVKSLPNMNYVIINFNNSYVTISFNNDGDSITISTGVDESFKCWKGSNNDIESFKTIINNFMKQTTENASANTSVNTNTTKTQKEYAKEYLKIIDEVRAKYSNTDLKYDLIYFNNDNIPDLVIGVSGYWVSLYVYEDGKVYNPVDEWSYGAMGNVGYDYLEKKGAIYNYNSDFAGGVGTSSISIYNSKHEFDTLSHRDKGADMVPTDPMYEEVQKDLEKTAGYYYNDQKISEQEFNNKVKEMSVSTDSKDYKTLDGSKSIEEIKSQLQ